jgi:predicted permease
MAGMEAAPEETAEGGGRRTRAAGRPASTFVNVVWPDYFRTLGTALLRGRDFRAEDRRGAPAVAIVNETLARRFWPGEDPLGRRIRLDEGDVTEVIGLARDGKYDELSEEPQPLLYLPYAQRPALLPGLILVVRATEDTGGTLAAARRMARELDPDLPLVDATSLAGLVRQRSDKQRSVSTLLAFFGSLALVLAGLGLYGVVSFTIARRTREIGVRLALGARPRQVVGLFLWQGVRLALVGVGIGLGPAAVLTALLSKVLFGIGVSDLTTFAGVALLLVATAAAACLVPARRAAFLQPSVALRLE